MLKSHLAALITSLLCITGLSCLPVSAQDSTLQVASGTDDAAQQIVPRESPPSSLEELRALGRARSIYLQDESPTSLDQPVEAQLAIFEDKILPILQTHCFDCHSEDAAEADLQIDRLNPDLVHGHDTQWWVEVFNAIGNGEMPPPEDSNIGDEDRALVVDWLSNELRSASIARREASTAPAFRRMSRYEYNYALQDLLGLPYDFATDLPPEAFSEEGFQNSSENLHLTAMQLATYRDIAARALAKATVRGERPEPIFWQITMDRLSANAFAKHEEDVAKAKRKHRDDPERLEEVLASLKARSRNRPNATHFLSLDSGAAVRATWNYRGARYAIAPSDFHDSLPALQRQVAVLPPSQRLTVELGNHIPDSGTLRVRVRAGHAASSEKQIPKLRLEFGWQASNNSSASVQVGSLIPIEAKKDNPEIYEWRIPLSEIYPRNPMRTTAKMGETPSPSEYLRFTNGFGKPADIHIDYIEISAPVYKTWPPESHQRIFVDSGNARAAGSEPRAIIRNFMQRAWRRTVSDQEVDQKMELLRRIQSQASDQQQAILEVLATVLASPKFLYIDGIGTTDSEVSSKAQRLASRLSFFLWCSIPDQQLRDLAASGQLLQPSVLNAQVSRMLDDPKAARFAEHFVRDWLGMQLLDYLQVDPEVYPKFDQRLRDALRTEPIAFFQTLLEQNRSIVDFIHADFATVNERLALHYGYRGIEGDEFQMHSLGESEARGGLLTQAGLLAMNSDGKDSHPLKRGIWLLERLLNDPPPPPPASVPEIDLTDPEIAKMSLKERIEDHRNQAACRSCHAKIDPWGIAFENYDAVGLWRTEVNGKPVDATSELFNQQPLDGMHGLKGFLLEHRQDQFARAVVYKVATYALGRPLAFRDRAAIDQITSQLRRDGDGLRTLIQLVSASELFQDN